MGALLTELIGTFFLVSAVGFTGEPIIIGSTLMAMVYMGGHVSGAHYNPAVTLAVLLRGKIETVKAISYILVQILGAVLAAIFVWWATGRTFAPAPAESVSIVRALALETVYTFALALVVLNVATAEGTKGNSFYGLAIGFTVFIAAMTAGDISGGAFNPAVAIGPTLIKNALTQGTLQHLWLYLAGPFLGGILAALVFKMQGQK